MADVKISALTLYTQGSWSASDLFVIVDTVNAITKKTTVGNLDQRYLRTTGGEITGSLVVDDLFSCDGTAISSDGSGNLSANYFNAVNGLTAADGNVQLLQFSSLLQALTVQSGGIIISNGDLIVSSGNFSLSGSQTSYNSIATVANGIPSLYALSNLTAQGAAISATTIYAPTISGAYRISYVATVTRAASTSSVLGGTNGFRIIYTDADDSVVKTSQDTAITTTLNTTAASISGVLVAYAKSGTNIQFSFDYTSVGVTTMQYNLHIRVEAI